jgi:hypothetical protein
MSVKVVTSGSDPIKVSVETIPAIKVTAPEVSVISVNPNYTTGQPGAAGPEGPQGPAGSDGAGVPSGGDEYQVVRKGNGDTTEWAFADRVFIAARFSEDVSEGDPVYVSGFHGSNGPIIVSKADASDSSKMPSIGLATQDYSQNNEGDVACIGSLKDVDTDSFSVGDVLYVASGGGLTNTKPTGTNLIQNVGKVGRSNQNNGEIVVMAIGRSNDVPNIPDGQAWIGNSSGVATPTTLADVATSGAYSDLTGTPTINNNVTTDITISRGTDTVTVESSDGTDGIIEEATGSKAGVMTVAMHDKLDGIDANADVTDSTSVGNAGAVMDADFNEEGLMKRNASSGSYSIVTDTDGIDEGTTNLFYTESRFNASLNGSTALRDADFGSAGMMKTDGSGTYSVITPGTGLAFDGTTIDVSANTTLSVDQNSSDVELKVTGPSGTESSAITFDAGTNISLTEAGNNTITIASTASGGGAEDLDDLTDVNVTGESANQYLVRNAGNTAFENQALDISHDTDPALGGNLDVSGNQIVSSSNGNIVINPDGTGNVALGNFTFDVDQDLTGKNDFVLTYDDVSRTISLEAASGGVDTSGTPVADQVAVFTDADTIEGDTGFTYDGTTNVLNVDHVEAKSVRVRSQGTSVLTGAGKFDVGSRVTYDINPSVATATGDIHVLKGSLWSLADADNVGNSKGLLAVAASTQASKGMVLQGVVRLDDNAGFSSATAGTVLYLSDTDGHAMSTTTSLGSGDVVRVIGYVLDGTNGIIYFDPSKDWIELA